MSHTSREARVSPTLFSRSHGRHQGWEDWLWQWTCHFASLMAWMVNSVIALQETWLWSPSLDVPLEKGMATHSSILTWRIPWTEEPGKLQSMTFQRFGHDWVTDTFTLLYCHHAGRVMWAKLNFLLPSSGSILRFCMLQQYAGLLDFQKDTFIVMIVKI